MARLYANENFPLDAVDALRARGHDVLTTAESGRGGRGVPDEEVLAFATDVDRAVVTLNRRDFIRLHATGVQHGGIVVCTVDSDFVRLAARIHDALSEVPDLHGQLLRVHRPL